MNSSGRTISLLILLGILLQSTNCQSLNCSTAANCPIFRPRCEDGECKHCVADEDCKAKSDISHIFCNTDRGQCYTQINLPADQAGVFASVLINAFICLAVIVFLLVALFKRESYKYSSVTEQQMSTLSNSQSAEDN